MLLKNIQRKRKLEYLSDGGILLAVLYLQKYICCTFFFVPIILAYLRPFEILYRKRSSIHTDGTEAVRTASCQINCRLDEGQNSGRSVMRWQPEGGF